MKMIEVYKAANEMEAQVIKGLLESFQIPCVFKANAAPSVHMFAVDGLGEVKIMVWEKMAEQAEELINKDKNV